MENVNLHTKLVSFASTVIMSLGLGETFCFVVGVENGTSGHVYSAQFVSLRQVYPVRQSYKFAIPRLDSRCTCDCKGGAAHCQPPTLARGNCPAPMCVATYHANQRAAGCPGSDGQADVCCQVLVTPHRSTVYQAFYLGQPTTAAQFRFVKSFRDNDTWTEIESQQLTMPLNRKLQADILEHVRLTISAGQVHWKLKEGMYFAPQDHLDDVRTGVPINQPYEWDTDKLGWFQVDSANRWRVENGPLKIQQMHHVLVEDCLEQRYKVNYNAFFYTVDEGEAPNLGYSLREESPWIRSIRLESVSNLSVIVEHSESPPMLINFELDGQSRVLGLSHQSQFNSLLGNVMLDQDGNYVMNISIDGAVGSFIGNVYSDSSRRRTELVFSCHVLNGSTEVLLMLPLPIQSSVWVCLYPVDKVDEERCAPFVYVASTARSRQLANDWLSKIGDCQDCNSDHHSLWDDPLKWLTNLDNPTRLLSLVAKGVSLLVGLVAVAFLFRRFILPTLRVVLGPKRK